MPGREKMNLIGQTFLSQVTRPTDCHCFKGWSVKRASFARDKQQYTEVSRLNFFFLIKKNKPLVFLHKIHERPLMSFVSATP